MLARHTRIAARWSVAFVAVALAGCQSESSAPTEAETPAAPSLPRLAAAPQAQARLEQVFERVAGEVLAMQGTVFADNDEVAGKLVFGVEHEGAARGVRQAMQRLGVSAGDYAVEVTSPIRQMATLRDKFDPTQAGIQLHFGQYVCTLGFNIDGGSKNGQPYGRSFITNSHCTNIQGGNEGTQYYQPQSGVSGVIATEADDPAYFKNAGCPKGKKCRYSDAARAAYNTSTGSTRGVIARTTGVNTGSLTINATNPFFGISSTGTAGVGTVVNKVGRTSGWTQGTVSRTCVHTSVQGSQVLQLCQTFVSHPSATIVLGGDSGSSVWMDDGKGGVVLVGLLWGGSSDNRTFIFSPLNQVQQELGTFSVTQ